MKNLLRSTMLASLLLMSGTALAGNAPNSQPNPYRTIRDFFTPDIDEIHIDNEEVYQRARDFLSDVMPGKVVLKCTGVCPAAPSSTTSMCREGGSPVRDDLHERSLRGATVSALHHGARAW